MEKEEKDRRRSYDFIAQNIPKEMVSKRVSPKGRQRSFSTNVFQENSSSWTLNRYFSIDISFLTRENVFKVEKQDSITISFLNASGFCQQWWLETSLFVVNLGYKIPRRWELVVQYVKFVSPVLWQTKYYTKQTGSISSCLIEAFISFLECMAKSHENNRTNTFFILGLLT